MTTNQGTHIMPPTKPHDSLSEESLSRAKKTVTLLSQSYAAIVVSGTKKLQHMHQDWALEVDVAQVIDLSHYVSTC